MDITQVQLKIVPGPKPETGVLAYVSIILDEVFVVKDIKLVATPQGKLIVTMPSRELTDRCSWCSAKNSLVHKFCHSCGERRDDRKPSDEKVKLYVDTAHPTSQTFRSEIEKAIFKEYEDQSGDPLS